MRKADGSTYLFHEMFDDTLVDIANFNLDIFSVQTGGEEKIKLFEPISQYVIESAKKPLFCRALINKLVEFNFAEVFEQKYDFFAQIFEYLIKDYNKDSGKYAEYYTPHTIATIIARIMVQGDVSNVTVYDPAAGSGTLVLALAHQIGEENCTIYTQDISAKSNEFLRLNLILNNLVHSLGNVVHDDTLIAPRHLNARKDGLAKFKLYALFYRKDDRDNKSLADLISMNIESFYFRGTCLDLDEFDEKYGFQFVAQPSDFDIDYLVSFCEYIYNFVLCFEDR